MVRIRLRRMGAKKKPFYRVVVADRRSPRNGRFIETVGTYDPLTEPETVNLKHERLAHWLSVGAQPSDAVARLLRAAELLDDSGKPLPYVPAPAVAESDGPTTNGSAALEESSSEEQAAEEPEQSDSASAVESPADENSAEEELASEEATGEEAVDEEAVDEASDESAEESDQESAE